MSRAPTGRDMQFFGHRGGSVEFPENTKSSITSALKNSDGAEFDVQWTVDNCVIVLHDETLERTAVPWSEGCGMSKGEYDTVIKTNVNELTLAQVQHVNVGWPKKGYDAARSGVEDDPNDPGEPVLTFPEALALLVAEFPEKSYLVEVKGGDERMGPLVTRDVLASGATPHQARLIGFDLPTMVTLKALLPAFRSVLIAHQKSEACAFEFVAQAVAANLDGIDLRACVETVTRPVVDAAHAAGLPLLVWVDRDLPGGDTAAAWDCLMARGVDLFTSDLPPASVAWLGYFEAARAQQPAAPGAEEDHPTRVVAVNTEPMSSDEDNEEPRDHPPALVVLESEEAGEVVVVIHELQDDQGESLASGCRASSLDKHAPLCAICLASDGDSATESPVPMVGLACGHRCCRACLHGAAQHGHAACPLCRRPHELEPEALARATEAFKSAYSSWRRGGPRGARGKFDDVSRPGYVSNGRVSRNQAEVLTCPLAGDLHLPVRASSAALKPLGQKTLMSPFVNAAKPHTAQPVAVERKGRWKQDPAAAMTPASYRT